MSVLSVEQMSAFYGARPVLHDVSLQVQTREVVAVLGANGAGKTTLLRAICGLVRVQGRIVLDGVAVQGRSTPDIARQGVAHVPEGRGTLTELTVADNLALAAHVRVRRAARKAAIARIYDYFPALKDRREQLAGTLSGGEQQMLAVGRALVGAPRLLLLDEPSLGMAPLVIKSLFATLRDIHSSEGIPMILVEQNAALALETADRAYILQHGRVQHSGAAANLRADPRVREAYFGGEAG